MKCKSLETTSGAAGGCGCAAPAPHPPRAAATLRGGPASQPWPRPGQGSLHDCELHPSLKRSQHRMQKGQA